MLPTRFSVRSYEGSVTRDFVPSVAAALSGIDDVSRHHGRTPSDICLIGPVPVFVVRPRSLLASRTLRSARRSGWRGLVTLDDVPSAIVDVARTTRHTGTTFRGGEPAAALYRALEVCQTLQNNSKGTSKAREVRILEIPETYITTVWIAGRSPMFVPTRLCSADRPTPTALSLEQLLTIVAQAARRRPRAITSRRIHKALHGRKV